jgi:4-alpha-glucanotransferase
MSTYDELINELADLCGIIPEYWDIFGNKHMTTIETKKAILKAMKLDIDSDEAIKNEIYAQKARPWNRFVEPVKVLSENEQPFKISIYVPVEEREEDKVYISWSIRNEEGQKIQKKDEFILSGNELTISDRRWMYGRRYIKIDLSDKCHRDIGYYSIDITFRIPNMEISDTSRLAITPDSCYMPTESINRKTWGLSINLYSIRSCQNWGSGDFGDLKKIVKWVSELKGGFVGINPLHAIPNKKPFGISPYSPITRLYKNFIYLDIESIPEVKELSSQYPVSSSQIDELRNSNLIDYEKVASLKISVLRNAFEIFYREHYLKDSIRCKDFRRYISEEGNNLESFSAYMALSNYSIHSPIHPFTHSPKNWQEWPEEYRISSSDPVQEFRKTHEKDILFYKYIQWLIDEQLKEISELAKNLGMPIGLYHDLAIGSIGGGSDVWNYQDVIAEGIDLGAPPDDFNPTGQNWGFPPLVPEKLKESGYEFFIQTIRKNMQHFGALRIDHALGMFRQFWIPKGMPASHGAYIKQPTEDLLRIIALESVRNSTVVIAEDLGTIGENVRETLFRFRMLSCRLLYFERNYPDPSFLSPERYPEMALCTVTTHDLPTIYGWWIGRDIELKKRLEIFADEGIYRKHTYERERDKELLLNALESQNIIQPSAISHQLSAMSQELCLAIYEYLACTPCKLLSVSLDDAIGTLDQQNMPGITDSYLSWQQKTPMSIEQIMSNEWFSSLGEMFSKNDR